MTNSKRSRRRRSVSKEEQGDSRIARERQSSAEYVLGCLRQRCADLHVPEEETTSLLTSLTQTLQPLLGHHQEDEQTEESFTSEDTKYSITKQGREFVMRGFGDDDTKKFQSTALALEFYQSQLAHLKDSGNSFKKIYTDFFCNFCLNDSSIDICAFCGCRKCFGKFSTLENSVSCAECRMEYHTFCCSLQSDGKYMCKSCLENFDTTDSKKSIASPSIVPLDDVDDSIETAKRNRVGRPRGSLNKATGLKMLSTDTNPESTKNVVSLESALEILVAPTFNKLTNEELHILDQMRLWGSKYELVIYPFESLNTFTSNRKPLSKPLKIKNRNYSNSKSLPKIFDY